MTSPPPFPQQPQPQHPQPRFGPLDFGIVFARSFSLLRQNPFPLLVIAALTLFGVNMVAMFVVAAIDGALQAQAAQADSLDPLDPFASLPPGLALISLLATVVQSTIIAIAGFFAQGFALANLRGAMFGARASSAELWQHLRRVWGRIVGLALLLTLIGLGFGVALVVPIFISVGIGAAIGPAGLGVAVVLVLLVLAGALVLGFWLFTKLSLSLCVLVFEQTSATAAMKRSWNLVRGRFWAVLGPQLLMGLIVMVAAMALFMIVLIPLGLSMAGDPYGMNGLATSPLILTLVYTPALLVSAVGYVIWGNMIGLLYLDARMRKEGLAWSLNAYAAGAEAGTPAHLLGDPYAVAHPHPQPPLPPQPYRAAPPQSAPQSAPPASQQPPQPPQSPEQPPQSPQSPEQPPPAL